MDNHLGIQALLTFRGGLLASFIAEGLRLCMSIDCIELSICRVAVKGFHFLDLFCFGSVVFALCTD